jgi:tetratricopeptide (TPR) repeat protein
MHFMKKACNININFLVLLLLFTLGACREDNATKKKSLSNTAVNTTDLLTGLGNGQWRMGNYQQALKYFTQAYNHVKSTGNERQMATLLNSLGLVQWRLENNNAAMECYDEAALLAEKLDMQRLLGLTCTNRSLIFKEQRKFDEAFKNNSKAIAIFKELKATKDLAIAYNNQGQIYRFDNQPEQALKYYNLSLTECQKIKYAEGMATAYQNLSTIYTLKADPKKAYLNAHKGLKISLKINSKVRISEAYSELSGIHEKFSRPDSALYYFKKYYAQEKKLMAAAQSETLSQYQASMGVEVKNLRIQNLQNERQIARNRLWFVALGILALLLIVFFLLYRYLLKVRAGKTKLQAALDDSLRIITVKEQELKAYIIDIYNKNNIIDRLQLERDAEISKDFNDEEVANLLGHKILTDDDWDTFKTKFAAIYPHFFGQLKESQITITEAEIRILVLMRLNLKSKDMADILGISPQSVRVCKMRLKKKLSVQEYKTVEDFLQHIIK